MSESLADVLAASKAAGGDWAKPQDFNGQVVTIVDFTVESGIHGEFVVANVVTDEGEEVQISSGGNFGAQVQGLNAADLLPAEVRIRAWRNSYGTMSSELLPKDAKVEE